MDYNYHTHTYRCHHAEEGIEKYILRAIECGIKYMGFSDHATHLCKDGHQSPFRVRYEEVEEYFSEISELREKYKDKIEIYIGFEMEYYPEVFDEMLREVISYGAEYLILGNHYLREDYPGEPHTVHPTEDVGFFKKFVENVVFGIKSGVFTYIAHPDVINFTGDKELYREEMRKICVASREYNVPLEINFLGIRTARNYPNDEFWKVAGEEGCPVTFGFDSHKIVDAYDGESLAVAEKMVEKYNLNYIGKPDLVFIQGL